MSVGQKGKEIEAYSYPRTSLLKKTGFSLIEILVVCLILGVILGALFISLTSGDLPNSVNSAMTDLQGKVRLIMDWMIKDVRQTNLIEINSNSPSTDHIKFKKVTGIDNGTGNYTLSADYIDYSYDSVSGELTRSEIDGTTGDILRSLVFDNITQSPFYTDTGVPLVAGGILTSKKLIVVIAGQSQARHSVTLTHTLTQEVKIRNE